MAQLVTRMEVLSAYRYLLRSMAIAFQGDSAMLSAAKKEARNRFELGRKLAAEDSEAFEGVKEARNVGKFLRQNLVQGIKDDKKDIYRMVPWSILINDQDCGSMTRLNEETIRPSKAHRLCQCLSARRDANVQNCHRMCL